MVFSAELGEGGGGGCTPSPYLPLDSRNPAPSISAQQKLARESYLDSPTFPTLDLQYQTLDAEQPLPGQAVLPDRVGVTGRHHNKNHTCHAGPFSSGQIGQEVELGQFSMDTICMSVYCTVCT
jgi:hypothetical protein